MVNILKRNSFRVARNEEVLFQMPAWVFALILLFFWETVIPIMLIALFFGIRYSFTGEDDLLGMTTVCKQPESIKNVDQKHLTNY